MDAIDIDFGEGTISDSAFNNIGGDAIDISGTNLVSANNNISNVTDKAISVGERSNFEGKSFTISNVAIAIACKDGSSALLDNSAITRARHAAYAAYIKKAEYSKPILEITNTSLENTSTESIALYPAQIIVDGASRASIDINANKILRAGHAIF